jgi:anti-sigma regulatory factor (Ser/Thr protein kinase)
VADPPNVFLRLSNSAENVTLVRQALSGVADQLALEAGVINDVRTAATEACNNVAVHAYAGGEGPLEVEIACRAHVLEVVVRDRGTGIRPRIRSQSDSALGIGLAVIQALARRVEFNDPPGGGTEVRMEFSAKPADGLKATRTLSWAPDEPAAQELGSTIVLAVAPPRLARSVLPRVLAAIAARAGFTTDRIADVQLIADALAARAHAADAGAVVRLKARVRRRSLELEVGPLPGELAHALIARPDRDGAAMLLGRLSDEHRIEADGHTTTLVLALAEHR